VVVERQPGDLTRTANLIIFKIGPKESPLGSGYTTSIRRCPMPQTELASANRVAFLEQLSASIAEINQPICAVVMGAEAALRLLFVQPTDTEGVRRLLACIVKDGMRTGDIVHRTCALIKESAATEGKLEINAVTLEATDIT
jgi:C4-dicarboxylate-specific signal transduction histidine kinase